MKRGKFYVRFVKIKLKEAVFVKKASFLSGCMALAFLCGGSAVQAQDTISAFTAPSLSKQPFSAGTVLPEPSAKPAAGYGEVVVTFPAYQEGKTAYNAKIYETKPFELHMALPDGWSVRQPQDKTPSMSGFTPMEIYSGKEQAGVVSFNVFEQMEGVPEDRFYRMVYNQLMLGATVNWDNGYTPVAGTDTACTATCQVMRKDNGPEWAGRMPDAPVHRSPGILSYDEKLLVYIAMDFQAGSVTDEQLRTVARSIRLIGI